MLVLILLIVFGLGMSFFATQNTGSVHVTLGNYFINDMPLYVLVIGSLLLGIFISWLISIVNSFSSTITLHGKVSEIRKAQDTIEKLKEENHQLEVENTRLKAKNSNEISENDVKLENINQKNNDEKPSFVTRLTHTV